MSLGVPWVWGRTMPRHIPPFVRLGWVGDGHFTVMGRRTQAGAPSGEEAGTVSLSLFHVDDARYDFLTPFLCCCCSCEMLDGLDDYYALQKHVCTMLRVA